MPRYRNKFGVLLDIPEEKAARINGLTPVDEKPSSPRKSSASKPSSNTEETEAE